MTTSAGLVVFRERDGTLEVLLGHMGGPFWARKDAGAWSIPKGELAPGEEPLAGARREFGEELEWPPRSGRLQAFAKLDRVAWLDLATARSLVVASQVQLLERLAAARGDKR